MENTTYRPYKPNLEIYRKVQYFLPGQAIFHIEHPPNVSKDVLAEALKGLFVGQSTGQQDSSGIESSQKRESREQITPPNEQSFDNQNGPPNEQNWRQQFIPPEPESIITFMREGEDPVFSIFPVQTRPQSAPRTWDEKLLNALYNLIQFFLPKQWRLPLYPRMISQKQLLRLIKSVNDEIVSSQNGIPTPDGSNIRLRSATAHWLLSSVHHSSPTGGPGSWPVEAHPPLGDEWKPIIKDAKGQNVLAANVNMLGDGVHVAILDTAPTEHALDTAYDEWRWQVHRLLEGMWTSNNRPLNLYPDTPANFHTLHESIDYSMQGSRYWRRDHGLFVAGIIHAIAPKATVHLYEMLNPFGVGTLASTGQRLIDVIQNANIKRPLIINCSFTLTLPKDIYEQFDVDPSSNLLLRSLKTIFEWLVKEPQVFVVAAAGNDSHIFSRKPTSYPAAFQNVFGVGALKNEPPMSNGRYRTASYSNRADDKNNNEGYMALGGEGGVEKGILGVYINDFPRLFFLWRILDWLFGWFSTAHVKYRRNTTGWAWWSGTSFATAIVTGTLAALPSQPAHAGALANFQSAQNALDQVFRPLQNEQSEKAIRAEQIPP